jgi:hypothetical protein
MNPAGITRDLAELMRESGCTGVELGVDATQEKMLRILGKGFSREDIIRAFEALKGTGIPFAAFMLCGGPGQTEEDLREEIAFLDSLPQPSLLGFSFGIRIYPGTRFAEWCSEEGFLDDSTDLLRPKYYLSPGFDEKMLKWFDRECLRRPAWNTTVDAASAVTRIMMFLGKKAGVRPYWRDAVTYGKFLRKINPLRRFARCLGKASEGIIVPERNRLRGRL